MRKLALILFAGLMVACGDTGASDGRSGDGGGGGAVGTGGSGGSGGSVEIPMTVDATCRTYCANEPGGMSCGMNGTAPDLSGVDTVQQCYENCLDQYEQQATLTSGCEDEWIAVLDCYIDLDCDDLFGDCDPTVQSYDECNPGGQPLPRNLVYCENPDVGAPSCSIPGFSIADDSALRAKLEGCTAAGCHGANAVTSWTLNLSGSVENALVPLSETIGVNGDYLVDQSDPDCSDILRKLTSDWGAGQRQPLAGTPWSTAETDCFRSYLHEISN